MAFERQLNIARHCDAVPRPGKTTLKPNGMAGRKLCYFIPPEAFNILDLPEVKNAINNGLLNDKKREIALNEKMQGKWGMKFNDYSKMLLKFGNTMHLEGPAVYYPFGGFDPFHPFMLAKGATDVFSLGIEDFGPKKDIVKLCNGTDAYYKAGGEFSMFESIRDMNMMLHDTGSKGLGSLALTRIVSHLGGRIEKICYFDIMDDGNLRFIDRDKIINDECYQNAVIEFAVTDPETSKEVLKRYWYVSYNVYSGIYAKTSLGKNDQNNVSIKQALLKEGSIDKDGIIQPEIENSTIAHSCKGLVEKYRYHRRFIEFIKLLQFQTMLIKAANHMWDVKASQEGFYENDINCAGYLEVLHKLTLQPAILNNAMVITDNRTSFSCTRTMGYKPHNIWGTIRPSVIELSGKQRFGYSQSGDYLYYGPADLLLKELSETTAEE